MSVDDRNSERDGLVEVSEDLVQSRTQKSAAVAVINFNGLLKTPLHIYEDVKDGCGGQRWPAGMILAEYLLREHGESMKDCTIVELGSGGGLVGLAVALGCLFKPPLIITDQLPMLDLMRTNIALNRLQDSVKPAIHDWGELSQLDALPKPDIILAADCVYFEPAFPLLHETLKKLMRKDTTCYFCFKRRRKADMRFVRMIKKTFEVVELSCGIEKEKYSEDNVFLYQLKLKKELQDVNASSQ